MDEIARLNFESSGYKVIELATPDPHFRTRFFITLPVELGGKTLANYDYLFQIPNSLNNGEEIAVNTVNQGVQTTPNELNQNNARVELFDSLYMGLDGQSLPIDWIMVGLVILVTALILMIAITLVRSIFAPCGIGGSIQEINDCWKLVIKPDCSARSFNTCADPDGDGIPEGDWGAEDWTKNFDLMKVLKWVVIGSIAIGGIVVVSSLLKSRERAQYNIPPPPSFREAISSRFYKPPPKLQPTQEYDISAYQ